MILIKTMKNTPEDFMNFVDGVNLNQDDFKVFNPETNAIIPLVYQSGYLTIKGYEDEIDTYFLRFPNKEVEEGFLKCLIPSYIKMIDSGIGLTIEKIRQSLREENIEKLMLLIKCSNGFAKIDDRKLLSDNHSRYASFDRFCDDE